MFQLIGPGFISLLLLSDVSNLSICIPIFTQGKKYHATTSSTSHTMQQKRFNILLSIFISNLKQQNLYMFRLRGLAIQRRWSSMQVISPLHHSYLIFINVAIQSLQIHRHRNSFINIFQTDLSFAGLLYSLTCEVNQMLEMDECFINVFSYSW